MKQWFRWKQSGPLEIAQIGLAWLAIRVVPSFGFAESRAVGAGMLVVLALTFLQKRNGWLFLWCVGTAAYGAETSAPHAWSAMPGVERVLTVLMGGFLLAVTTVGLVRGLRAGAAPQAAPAAAL